MKDWNIPKTRKINQTFYFYLFVLILILVFIFGCAGQLSNLQNKPSSTGFLAGATSVKALQTIKKVFVAKYPYYYAPTEVCTILPHEQYIEDLNLIPDYLKNPQARITFEELLTRNDIWVKCIIAPCRKDLSCDRTEPFSVFLARNKGKFSSIEVSSYGLSAAKEFCSKNELDCLDAMAGFQNGTLLIEARE